MESLETLSLVKTFGALGLVIGLIAIAALLARHFGMTGGGGGFRRRDEKRLGVVESLTLDARRRVLLVRHDNSEHLILLGSNSEVVLAPNTASAPPKLSHPTPPAPPQETQAPGQGPAFKPRMPYRRDEPTLGPYPTTPPRGR